MSRRLRLLIYSLFLVSGGTALIYQVAWTRDLSLIFGASHQAISIVLASFMAGLALGGVVFGRMAERVRRPLRVYALLELGVAGSALALPYLLAAADHLYIAAAVRAGSNAWSIAALRTAMAFGILILPTFFMGGTLPLLTQVIVRQLSDLGTRLSWLYGINTLGAVFGAVAAGFVIMPRLGVWHTQLLAIGITCVVGAVALLIDWRGVGRDAAVIPNSAASANAKSGATASTLAPSRHAALRLAFLGTAVSGLCALGLEVMWTRAISIATGTTIYSFTMMLAAFLLGIAIGSAVHALGPMRRVHTAVQFGAALAVIGISSFIVTLLIPRLPEYSLWLDRNLYGGLNGARPMTTLVLSFIVMLVPCVFMGMAFPMAGQARAELTRGIGRSVGDLVAYNTFGAIAGSLLAGFVLIPGIGLHRGLLLLSAVNLGYGMIVLFVAWGGESPARRTLAGTGIVLSLAMIIAVPVLLPNWNAEVFTRFQNNNPAAFLDRQGKIDVNARLAEMTPLYYREGPCSNVAVLEMNGLRSLVLNGRCVATEVESDLHHEMMLGHLPVLLHPNPKSAVVVGLGASITLGGVVAHPELNDITVVEIEPAVYGGAEYFNHVTGNALHDPRVRKVVQDGRNFLLTSPAKYDVITADPIHPWSQGSTYLYTTEYCGMCAQRLNPGGIMCLWLPLYELSPDHLKSVVATFAANFAHTSLWQASADIVIIGSNSPLSLNLDATARRLREPSVQRQLGRLGLGDPLSLLAECVMDDQAVRRYSQGAIINTDDNLYLEFSSPLTIGSPLLASNAASFIDNRVNPSWLLDRASRESPEWPGVVERLESFQRAKAVTIQVSLQWLGALRTSQSDPVGEIITTLRGAVQMAPDYARGKVLLSEALTTLASRQAESRQNEQAMQTLQEALALNPEQGQAHKLLGIALCDASRPAEALPHFDAALDQHPDDAATHHNYGVALLSLRRPLEALPHLEESIRLRPNDANAHRSLGVALLNLNRVPSAIDQFQAALGLRPQDAQVRDILSVSLYRAGLKAQAIEVLREGVKRDPDQPRINQRLAWMLATCGDASLRNGADAVRLARRAVEATQSNDAPSLDTLAAALAETGQFPAAIDTAQKALSLTRSQNNTTLVGLIERRIALYQSGKAFHEE